MTLAAIRTEPASASLRGAVVPLEDYLARANEAAALSRASPEPNVFFEPDFLRSLVEAHGGAERWRVALAFAGDRLVGALPLTVEPVRPHRPVRRLIARGHVFMVLSTPLIAEGMAEPALLALIEALAASPDLPPVLALPFLGAGGPAGRALEAVARATGRRLAVLDRYTRAGIAARAGGPAAYELERFPNKDKRKKWRQECRKLDGLGTVALTRHARGEACGGFEDFLVLEAAGWKGRAGTAILEDARDAAFMRGAIAGLAADVGAEIFALRLDGRAIAAALVLRSGREWWFLKIAYDEAHGRAGPGARLAHEVTMAMLAEPDLAFGDSCALRGGGLLEAAWTDQREIADVMIALRPGASAAFSLAVAAERVRRAVHGTLKSAWHAVRARLAQLRRARARAGG